MELVRPAQSMICFEWSGNESKRGPK